jgi:DNA-binding LacI/PurR family transcriptional regulator
MTKKFASIKDIAELCGVSKPTVSDVLNGKAKQKRISSATSEKVLAAAEKLNYQVNLQARNMLKGRSFTIGAVFCRMDNSFYSRIFHGFYDICIKNNCSPLVFASDWSPEKENSALMQLMGMRVDGIVISPAGGRESFANIEKLIERKMPLCIFEQDPSANADFIGFDNRSAIADAVSFLIKKGRKKICIVLREGSSMASRERLSGFKDGLKLSGMEFSEDMLFMLDEQGRHDLDYFQSGYESALRIFQSGNKPDSLIALNDEFAFGAYRAAEESGMKIPEDLAVIGYGDRDFSLHMSPPLTTLKQDLLAFLIE